MHIVCLGATRTVTGSSFLVELDDKASFLVDCGLFQGGRQIEMRNWSSSGYRVENLAGIFITHAHIDHSGLVPRLVRNGYKGPIYATEATCDLLQILWLDSAHIQEMESQWRSRKNRRKGEKAIAPLYETADAEAAALLLKPLDMNKNYNLIPGVVSRYVQAGHILGAASLHLTIQGKQGVHRLGFSGDLGRPGQLIVPDPGTMPRVNTLFMETTYGNRRHKSLVDSVGELVDVVNQAYREGGKVIIPAFAVERTQEIIYTMARAYEKDELPRDMPIYLDSPLAINATNIFRQHPEFFDQETKKLLRLGRTPINLPGLKFTLTTEDSQRINTMEGPAVIISGSGMANAGRVKHHLKHNLWRPNCHVVIVGFQAQGTTGRQLVDGAESVTIFREKVAVRAKIHTIGGFSAHADQQELLDWLAAQAHPGLKVNLVHGEESSTIAFKAVAEARFPEVNFNIPDWKAKVELSPTPEIPQVVKTAESLAARLDDLSRRLSALGRGLASREVKLDDAALTAMEQALTVAEDAAARP